MQSRRQGGKGLMGIKLDMNEAYDWVEWPYLQGIMGFFLDKWIDLIIKCVTSLSYSLLINGQSCGIIKPTRGVCQGCPLSSYFFLLCAEGLSTLLNKVKEQGDFHGIRVVRGATRVSHLLLADDSLIFAKATKIDDDSLMEVWVMYEKASSLKVKSGVLFSPNVWEDSRQIVIWGNGKIFKFSRVG